MAEPEFAFEEDELEEEEDVVLLSEEEVFGEPRSKKGNKLFNAIPSEKLLKMENDDDIIDYFLTH